MMHQNNTDLHFSNTEELLQTILDDSNQMIQVSELDTLHMLYANQTARAYTGHGDQPYQGVPFINI